MKIHLGWIKWTANAAIVAASTAPAAAQYPPYRAMPVMPTTTQPAAATQPVTGYSPQVPYVAYREGSVQAPAQRAAMTPATTAATAPARPTYQATPYRATQPAPQPYRVAQLTPPASQSYQPAGQYQSAAPYQMTGAPYVPSAYPQTAAPANRYGQYTYVAQQPDPVLPPQGDTNNGAANASPTNEAATNAPAVHATSSDAYANGIYNSSSAGACGCNTGGNFAGVAGSNGANYGVTECGDDGCDRVWFGGVYFLWMTRDNPDFQRYAVQVSPAAYPYYPTSDVTVLSSSDVDYDYRPGGEVRFGSTLRSWWDDDCDNTGCGPYGYGHGGGATCAAPVWAWEFGYWILDDDENTAEVIDALPTDTYRIYGTMNFAGLQYNGEPVNKWYDYQVPIEDPVNPPPWGSATQVRVLAQRVRTNFQAQNLELNLLRLPLCGTACGNGCESCEGAPACDSPVSVTTLCGFRYLRVDDDFQYATMWATDTGGGVYSPPAYTPWGSAGNNELFYDINVDNHLTGFQLGANMSYCVSCKCSLFWNSNFGLYNNHISSDQQVFGNSGYATFSSGETASISSSKDDVAFIGELLLGGSYQVTYNWRAVLAYRAVAVSGVALSVDQIPQDFSDRAQVALIDSDGSLIIHGLQVGAECRY